MGETPKFTLLFYEDDGRRQPVREWLQSLPADHRRTVGAALREVLQEQGVAVCGSAFGKALGKGLFEFRLRTEGLLVRVFCHAYGDHLILLLGAYDKGDDPSPRRQTAEIDISRRRLAEWQARQRR